MQRTPEMREMVDILIKKIVHGNSATIELKMPHSNSALERYSVWIVISIWEKSENQKRLAISNRVRSNRIESRCSGDKVYYPLKGTECQFIWFHTESDGRMEDCVIAEQIMDCIEKCETEINGLFQERRTGAWVNINNDEEVQTCRLIDLTIKAFAHAKYNPYGEPCCVCNEITDTKTRCGHHLCMDCWERLEKLVCPMCREDVDQKACEGCECSDSDDD